MEKGTVWIIGGSSGLGLATAQAFAKDGWFVLTGARSFHTAKQDGLIHELPLDVTDSASRAAFMREAFALHPRVDVLVYCAAILVLSPCELTAYDDYARVMQTNFLGMTDIVAQVLPHMRQQQSGKIVLFSSINGLLGILSKARMWHPSTRWRAMQSAWPWSARARVSRYHLSSRAIIAAAASGAGFRNHRGKLVLRLRLCHGNQNDPARRKQRSATIQTGGKSIAKCQPKTDAFPPSHRQGGSKSSRYPP